MHTYKCHAELDSVSENLKEPRSRNKFGMTIGILLLLILSLFSLPTSIHALTPTPTTKVPTTTAPTQSDVINELKERIASRVAQLKLVERRGIVGTVTDISDTQITLSDTHNNVRFIDVDELTKFSSPSTKEAFGISDITKGNKLSILGLYNKQSRRILARFVNVITTPTVLHATIISVDEDNFSTRVITDTKEVVNIDIEKTTKTLSYTKEDELIKSGFSKLSPNQHAIIIGFPDAKEKKRYVASRFIIFPDIPKNPQIIIPQEALSTDEEPIVSTGSGNKLTPLR